MAQKLINTRIGLKYDTYARWTRTGTWDDDHFDSGAGNDHYWGALLDNAPYDGFIPLKGEVCFFEIPTSTNEVASEPAILFKVGDGEKNLHSLPWGSAIAADVYAWAKNQSLLGGTNNGGTWTWSSDPAYAQEQAEVAAFIKEETSDIKIKVSPISTPPGQTGDHWYQTYVSQDGGTTWEATGDPFQVEIDAYTAGDGLDLINNKFSIKTSSDYLSLDSVDGIDVVTTNVVYTPAAGDNPANLTASGTGVVTNAAIAPIKNYIDNVVSSATPNIQSGNGINITTSGSTKTISVKLDNVTHTQGLTQNSGLSTSAEGLRINDTLLWIFQCGGAG